MARMKLISLRSLGDFSRIMLENDTLKTDISYSTGMKAWTKGIALCQSLWSDLKPRSK